MSIFSNYTSFWYIYPPRADAVLKAAQLPQYGDAWIAQPKYNGSCAVVFINGRNDCQLFNRHGEKLTLQIPLNYTALNDSDKFMVLCGEYLNKNKNGESGTPFNHKFIIWDILVHKGVYLVGQTVEERLNLLYTLFGASRGLVHSEGFSFFNHLLLTNTDEILLAPTYMGDFLHLYNDIVQTDLYEGLVLKKKNAPLELGIREKNNTGWQMKVRKETKSYRF